MPDYDVAVIGGGPGGYTAAIRASQLGLRAVLIEKEAVGGLCLNWGCIPSKALLHGADLVRAFARAPAFGIEAGPLRLDLGVSVDRSRDVVAKMVGGIETLLAQNGVTVVHGGGRITKDKTVAVSDGQTITAENIVIATGGQARTLPFRDSVGDRFLTSRDALALRKAPESVVIIGGGAIGVEFAYLWRTYGSEVTIVEAMPRMLPNEDEEVSSALERSFSARGIEVITNGSVSNAVTDGKGIHLSLNGGRVLDAEYALEAVGFTGNVAGLGLEELGVQLERAFVKVDAYCRTNVPGIWAVGDVTGELLMAHVAAHQACVVVDQIAGRTVQAFDYTKLPRAVFCQPQVASIGLTEAQARARGPDIRVGRFPLRANGMAAATDEAEGFVKVMVDVETEGIAGCHVIGQDAAELISQVSVAMLLEVTAADLASAVQAHPTVAEAIKEAAQAANGGAIHFFSSRT